MQVVPATFAAEDVLALKPDGVFLSTGPAIRGAHLLHENIRKLVGRAPVSDLPRPSMPLRMGGKTFKLKLDTGGKQPVKDLRREVTITSQNHGSRWMRNHCPRSKSPT